MSRFRTILFGLALLASAACADTAGAQSGERQVGADDLSVRIITKWIGGGDGGYFPIRIRLINTGESRQLTFRLESVTNKQRIPVVTKTVRADRNASMPFTLSVPLVGNGSSAILKVLDENEDEIESLAQRIELPAQNAINNYSPSVLIISDVPVDGEPLEFAAEALAVQNAGYSSSFPGRGSTTAARTIYTHISAAFLPDSWIDYTTLDIVAVDLAVLVDRTQITSDQHSALLKWVQCGGTLLVRNVGDRPQDSKSLQRALQIKADAASTSKWRGADVSLRSEAENVNLIVAAQQMQSRRSGRSTPQLRTGLIFGPRSGRFSWRPSPEAFALRDEKLGTVVAFRNDPFVATTRDWLWLLKVLKPERYRWAARHGMSARRDSGEFLNFLIPGVKGVPVYAFLFLMTVFTLVIGPLNYVLLWKRKQLFLLVLTIPVVAFVTSLSLFGYSAVSHGFSVKSRVRSLTILDQLDKTAVTTSRVALFAGLAPSDGLHFSTDTAVYPIWPQSNMFETGVVNWGDSQALQSGWLRSRTRTQFLTMLHYNERGRLEIKFAGAQQATVINGFEVDIESLLVSDENRRVFSAGKIAAGQSNSLKPVEEKFMRVFIKRITDSTPRQPENLSEYRDSSIFNVRQRRYRNRRGFLQRDTKVAFSSALMERRIAEIVDLPTGKYQLPANTYVAILRNNPRAPIGLGDTDEVDGFHLLIGRY